jgi:hypothetical protein
MLEMFPSLSPASCCIVTLTDACALIHCRVGPAADYILVAGDAGRNKPRRRCGRHGPGAARESRCGPARGRGEGPQGPHHARRPLSVGRQSVLAKCHRRLAGPVSGAAPPRGRAAGGPGTAARAGRTAAGKSPRAAAQSGLSRPGSVRRAGAVTRAGGRWIPAGAAASVVAGRRGGGGAAQGLEDAVALGQALAREGEEAAQVCVRLHVRRALDQRGRAGSRRGGGGAGAVVRGEGRDAGLEVEVFGGSEVDVAVEGAVAREGGELGEGAAVGLEDGLRRGGVPAAHPAVLDVRGALALQEHEHLVARAAGADALVAELGDEGVGERRDAAVGGEEARGVGLVGNVEFGDSKVFGCAASCKRDGIRERSVDETGDGLAGGICKPDANRALLAKARREFPCSIDWVDENSNILKERIVYLVTKVRNLSHNTVDFLAEFVGNYHFVHRIWT